MSKSAGRSMALGHVFAAGAASAAAAFFLRGRAAAVMAPYLRKYPAVPVDAAAYVLLFAAAFIALSFLGRHLSVRFSLKARGLERTKGAAPKFARAFLALFFLAVPLALMQLQADRHGASLESLIAASDRKAAAGPEQGYKKDDRAKLEHMMEGKP